MSPISRTTLLGFLLALLAPPASYLYTRLSVFGAFRTSLSQASMYTASGTDDPREIFTIPDIAQAEDLAFHEPSGLVVVAGQGEWRSRFKWWPPWAVFDDPSAAKEADGGVWVIDPKSWETTRLVLDGFEGPLVTHGIEVYSSPTDSSSLYIYVINHPPLLSSDKYPLPIADSRIEIFHLNLASSPLTATHLRSVKHPLITTPNDLVALGPGDLLVTNDHVNRQGWRRRLEDILTFSWISKTTIVRVRVDLDLDLHLDKVTGGGVQAEVVLSGLHNANGLHRGPNDTILLCDASGGVFTLLSQSFSQDTDTVALTAIDSTAMPTTLDNPTYFTTLHPSGGGEETVYVLAGLSNAIKLDEHAVDPEARVPSGVRFVRRKEGGEWEKKLILEDDGNWVSGASVAMILPIQESGSVGGRDTSYLEQRQDEGQIVFDESKPGSDKQGVGKPKDGWLLMTGPWSRGIGVIKVDLGGW
ncbi:hypothetical protein IAR55_006395 [Kwoniella newhampshirensis]|uniref:Calcium-dependent phosphotriesterase n=1 Tax=Kwoniella newhampshirensis TaxID=1651941 RepID=A0AAW0YU47_9TREE